ncbi:hypothetical protein NW756_001580 [Fusarium oxysporum]|nr:hypothetical protein NW763_008296 [Fusarium oxysporum]KAJ4069256.1 hypothetical protein NW753_000136 [Fusarium oxysporum]KAJ4101170.1 hypothetical protein NW756_001580 [Fusarium oxysporum]
MELHNLCVYLEKEEGTNDTALNIHDLDASTGFAPEHLGLRHGYMATFRDQDCPFHSVLADNIR